MRIGLGPVAPYNSATPAPATARPSISSPIAAVCLGAHAPAVDPDEAATDPVPVAVAVEEPVPVAVAEVVAAEAVPVAWALAVAQLTTVGTVTPWAEQIWVAKTMALVWSASLQAPTRQQAMLERKSWLLQIHLGSVPQPAYEPPENCCDAQSCCCVVRGG